MISIEAVKQHNEEQLLRLPNVIGVGIGEKSGKQVIKVFVTHKVPLSELQPQDVIPTLLEDYDTDIEALGVIEALS